MSAPRSGDELEKRLRRATTRLHDHVPPKFHPPTNPKPRITITKTKRPGSYARASYAALPMDPFRLSPCPESSLRALETLQNPNPALAAELGYTEFAAAAAAAQGQPTEPVLPPMTSSPTRAQSPQRHPPDPLESSSVPQTAWVDSAPFTHDIQSPAPGVPPTPHSPVEHVPPTPSADSSTSPQATPASSGAAGSPSGVSPTKPENLPRTDGHRRVMVTARVRPLLPSEPAATQLTANTLDNSVRVSCGDQDKLFFFDNVLGPDASQAMVYRSLCRSLIEDAFNGINGCIIAYGQTGAGKTYTLCELKNGHSGIIPRAMQDLFERIEASKATHDYAVTVSYLQIYMETIQDLLQPENNNLPLREGPAGEVFVAGLSAHRVRTVDDVTTLLEHGARSKVVAQTKLNRNSSRSHAVLLVHLVRRDRSRDPATRRSVCVDMGICVDVLKPLPSPPPRPWRRLLRSTLIFVDLAGSERAGRTHPEGIQLDEAKSINLSLSALGNCVAALAEERPQFIPWRDSKITRLLQGIPSPTGAVTFVLSLLPLWFLFYFPVTSFLLYYHWAGLVAHTSRSFSPLWIGTPNVLGGNSRTSLVVNIGPSDSNTGESLSSLLFGQRAMRVAVHPVINEEIDYKSLAMNLQVRLEHMMESRTVDYSGMMQRNEQMLARNAQLENELEQLRSRPLPSLSPSFNAPACRLRGFHEMESSRTNWSNSGPVPFLPSSGLTSRPHSMRRLADRVAFMRLESNAPAGCHGLSQSIGWSLNLPATRGARSLQRTHRRVGVGASPDRKPDGGSLEQQKMLEKLQTALAETLEAARRSLANEQQHNAALQDEIATLERNTKTLSDIIELQNDDGEKKSKSYHDLRTRLIEFGQGSETLNAAIGQLERTLQALAARGLVEGPPEPPSPTASSQISMPTSPQGTGAGAGDGVSLASYRRSPRPHLHSVQWAMRCLDGLVGHMVNRERAIPLALHQLVVSALQFQAQQRVSGHSGASGSLGGASAQSLERSLTATAEHLVSTLQWLAPSEWTLLLDDVHRIVYEGASISTWAPEASGGVGASGAGGAGTIDSTAGLVALGTELSNHLETLEKQLYTLQARPLCASPEEMSFCPPPTRPFKQQIGRKPTLAAPEDPTQVPPSSGATAPGGGDGVGAQQWHAAAERQKTRAETAEQEREELEVELLKALKALESAQAEKTRAVAAEQTASQRSAQLEEQLSALRAHQAAASPRRDPSAASRPPTDAELRRMPIFERALQEEIKGLERLYVKIIDKYAQEVCLLQSRVTHLERSSETPPEADRINSLSEQVDQRNPGRFAHPPIADPAPANRHPTHQRACHPPPHPPCPVAIPTPAPPIPQLPTQPTATPRATRQSCPPSATPRCAAGPLSPGPRTITPPTSPTAHLPALFAARPTPCSPNPRLAALMASMKPGAAAAVSGNNTRIPDRNGDVEVVPAATRLPVDAGSPTSRPTRATTTTTGAITAGPATRSAKTISSEAAALLLSRRIQALQEEEEASTGAPQPVVQQLVQQSPPPQQQQQQPLPPQPQQQPQPRPQQQQQQQQQQAPPPPQQQQQLPASQKAATLARLQQLLRSGPASTPSTPTTPTAPRQFTGTPSAAASLLVTSRALRESEAAARPPAVVEQRLATGVPCASPATRREQEWAHQVKVKSLEIERLELESHRMRREYQGADARVLESSAAQHHRSLTPGRLSSSSTAEGVVDRGHRSLTPGRVPASMPWAITTTTSSSSSAAPRPTTPGKAPTAWEANPRPTTPGRTATVTATFTARPTTPGRHLADQAARPVTPGRGDLAGSSRGISSNTSGRVDASQPRPTTPGRNGGSSGGAARRA
ncbi:putative Kinesin heavy chain [Paratrimastix pyriformis]|uniref:Kinesin heavy chain n=1 Tax=Paratrimastix pyriformis TaxID=342808 RepID=A0ABQ8UG90_9EUKA|nr:putative Kinesin heavy chain [Paratrimastix pyriformis]